MDCGLRSYSSLSKTYHATPVPPTDRQQWPVNIVALEHGLEI